MTTQTEAKKFKEKYTTADLELYGRVIPLLLESQDPRSAEFLEDFSALLLEIESNLEEIVARQKEKLRRYRLQIKQLQRAHILLKREFEHLKRAHDSLRSTVNGPAVRAALDRAFKPVEDEIGYGMKLGVGPESY